MITDDRSRKSVPDASAMAVAVLAERIRDLPKEDKQDLFELTKALFEATTEEEFNSAYNGMQEILEQEQSTVVRVFADQGMNEALKKWVTFVGGRIRTLRREAGLTQEQLSEKCGLPQSHISRLENGEHSPSYITLEKIACSLGVPVSELDPSAPEDQ